MESLGEFFSFFCLTFSASSLPAERGIAALHQLRLLRQGRNRLQRGGVQHHSVRSILFQQPWSFPADECLVYSELTKGKWIDYDKKKITGDNKKGCPDWFKTVNEYPDVFLAPSKYTFFSAWA